MPRASGPFDAMAALEGPPTHTPTRQSTALVQGLPRQRHLLIQEKQKSRLTGS